MAGSEQPDRIDLTTTLHHLLVGTRRMPPDDVLAAVEQAVAAVALSEVEMYLPDFSRRYLRSVRDPNESLTIHGTVAGRAYSSESIIRLTDEQVVFVPMQDGEDRVGVLRFHGDLEAPALELIASVVASLLVSRSRLTDFYRSVRATHPMSLAARVQWEILPPQTFSTEELGVACALEPAYNIGGDSFDYSLNGQVLSFGIFDAMGHGTQAALTAATAVSVYRHGRDHNLSLQELYRRVDTELREHRSAGFVTAVMAELDCASGRLRWLNAGHPEPFLLRGHRVPGALHCPPMLPLGLGDLDDGEAFVAETELEPGDRVLLYTDGVIDTESSGGEPFGEERVADYLARHAVGRQLAEAVRQLVLQVVDFSNDQLGDDATLLLVAYRDIEQGT